MSQIRQVGAVHFSSPPNVEYVTVAKHDRANWHPAERAGLHWGTELRVIRSAEKLQTKPGFWTEFTSEPDGVWVEKVRKTHLLMFPEPSAGAAGRCLSFCSIVLIRLTHVRRRLRHLSVSVPPSSLPHCPEYDPPWSRWGPGSSTNCSPNNCREL